MAVGAIDRVQVVGSKTVPRLVVANLTFVDGVLPVNAADLEANKILGFAAAPWDVDAGVGQMVGTTTTFVVGGVATVNLELVTDNSVLVSGSAVVTAIFWCE